MLYLTFLSTLPLAFLLVVALLVVCLPVITLPAITLTVITLPLHQLSIYHLLRSSFYQLSFYPLSIDQLSELVSKSNNYPCCSCLAFQESINPSNVGPQHVVNQSWKTFVGPQFCGVSKCSDAISS